MYFSFFGKWTRISRIISDWIDVFQDMTDIIVSLVGDFEGAGMRERRAGVFPYSCSSFLSSPHQRENRKLRVPASDNLCTNVPSLSPCRENRRGNVASSPFSPRGEGPYTGYIRDRSHNAEYFPSRVVWHKWHAYEENSEDAKVRTDGSNLLRRKPTSCTIITTCLLRARPRDNTGVSS